MTPAKIRLLRIELDSPRVAEQVVQLLDDFISVTQGQRFKHPYRDRETVWHQVNPDFRISSLALQAPNHDYCAFLLANYTIVK